MAGPESPSTPEDTTVSPLDDDHVSKELSEPVVTVLVVAWCRQEPMRAGEIAVLPPEGPRLVLGRGSSDDEPRLRFSRPRPGRLEPTLPLAAPGLSRRQIEIVPRGGALEVRRVGRCTMRINGAECETGTLEPGDSLALGQELVLYCMRRPACPPPLRYFDPANCPKFAGADTFGILGESLAVWRLREELAFAAKSERHVLIVGDSGTGKELAALAIRGSSSRAERPFVARNAATLPSGLVDAELFGNLKNYPNPGMAERLGIIGQADGGTLFLDEIGELPHELQSHLLRVLDSGGEYQRLGEATLRRSDFRLLAATNRDPTALRPDFLARLAVKVEVPPLSERRLDIPLLARHLVVRAAQASPELVARFVERRDGLDDVRMDARLVEALLHADFPLNVRALDALLWKAMAASAGNTITFAPSLFATEPNGAATKGNAVAPQPRARNREPSEDDIREALRTANGSIAAAAKALGLSSRYALYRLVVKLRIEAGEGG